MLCCGYTLTDFPISIRLISLARWQSNDCPSASKATLMNMDKYFMWIHYERLHNHNKAKHNKTVCIFLGIYCKYDLQRPLHLELLWFILTTMGPFYYHGLTVIPAWISNHIHYKMRWITYPCTNFIGCTNEVWEWISNIFPHFMTYSQCNYLSTLGLKLRMSVKGVPERLLSTRMRLTTVQVWV